MVFESWETKNKNWRGCSSWRCEKIITGLVNFFLVVRQLRFKLPKNPKDRKITP